MKPVAYITKYDLERLPLYDCWVNGEKSKGSIPLYTYPVKDKPHPKCDEACMYLCQMRELTDEEINKLWAESHEDGIAMQQGFNTQQHYFAHLILRKAQE